LYVLKQIFVTVIILPANPLYLPSVLWHCSLGVMKCIQPVKKKLIRRWDSEREFFLRRHVQPLLRSAPWKLQNSVKYHKIRAIMPFKVIRRHRYLVPIESSYTTSY